MKLFAYINLLLALGLVIAFGMSASLVGVLGFVSPVLHAELGATIARLPPGGGLRALLLDVIGWPAWAFPLAFAFLAGLVVVGRFERRG